MNAFSASNLFKASCALVFASSLILASFNALAISASDKETLTNIRNAIFGGSRISAAFEQSTISGATPPVFPLEITQRGLLVWKIDPSLANQFAQAVALPPGFTLAKVPSLTVVGSQTLNARLISYLEGKGLGWLVNALMPKHYYVIADIGHTQRAEQGAKVAFKTFVTVPDDSTPRLFRFSSHKAVPGVDLLSLATSVTEAVTVTQSPGLWQGQLDTPDGQLTWRVPLAVKRSGKPRTDRKKRFSQGYLDASEVEFSPAGAARVYYDGSSVSSGFQMTKQHRIRIGNTLPWSQYLMPGSDVLLPAITSEFLVQPITAPVQNTQFVPGIPGNCGDTPVDASTLFANLIGCALAQTPPEAVFGNLFAIAQSRPEVMTPEQLPTLYFALLDFYQGLQITQGAEKPKLFFALLPDPKAIFINFQIPKRKVRAFEQAFLPAHFKLAKMKFYPEQPKPVYAVSLNVYQSTGQNLTGFRAEWSTYVVNPNETDPKPRFSVLEAQTNIGGFDAVVALERYRSGMNLADPQELATLIEDPTEDFTYKVDPVSGITIALTDPEEGIEVDVQMRYPSDDRILTTAPLTGWMEANDFVYWGEVADVLKYDSNVMFAELQVFEPLPTDRVFDNTFADYVDPKPLPIILWNGKQDIALEPWGNLDSIPVSD